jgi:hypothetical protein
MADENKNINQVPTQTNSFNKGLLKDYNETFIGEGLYTHARNAVNNSHDGNVGVIGNEPSNLFCVKLPYTLIGSIAMFDDKWVLFLTNDQKSEIGIFDESECSYTKIINSDCLNFKTNKLITGVFRQRYDCERVIYWDDGLNPTRSLNIDDIPFKYVEKYEGNCLIKEYTDELDCEAIRLSSLINHPCIKISKGVIAGTLENGSYQACIAYTINQVRITDYIGLSEVQPLFTHEDVSSSLEIDILDIDKRFDEFELVILANIENQSLAKRIGYYSTSQGKIYVDRWGAEFINIPVSDIVFRSQPIEKTDAMYSVNNYLLRVGVYSKFKFNYQPLANKINANWVAVEYPADYYIKGGNNAGYMRDEQYAFFIRWIYNTGERSESYHIPGRAPSASDTINYTGDDAFELKDGIKVKKWQVLNTAKVTSFSTYKLDDGGVVIAKGIMGYWESTEKYPNNQQSIWQDLCGKNIRHHKFPDVTIDSVVNHFNTNGTKIVILGVEFNNIAHPLDEFGNPIESIVGYEILRGSRQGATSIVAKGIINNMREYKVPENPNITGLYQNYPYNDLRSDLFLTNKEQRGDEGSKSDKPNGDPLVKYKKNVFSFHSPEVSFNNPFLNVNELKIYQELSGQAKGVFETPYLHPKFKLITNSLDTAITVFAGIIATVQTAASVAGGLGITLSSDPDLPAVELGIPRVIGEGTTGAIANIAVGTAIVANALLLGAYTFLFGAKVYKQQILSIALGLMPYKQFAAQYNSHGFYNQSNQNQEGNQRRKIIDAGYVDSSIQSFSSEYQINNTNRSPFVILKVDSEVENPKVQDISRVTMSQANVSRGQAVTSTISSYYGAIKVPIPSQYGQLNSIKQFIVSDCVQKTIPDTSVKFNSAVFFGGDIYINRFTEKNSMIFFNTWLKDEPDGIDFDYTLYPAIPYPRYWLNSRKIVASFTQKASELRSLDKVKEANFYYLESGAFYLFNSGVRDFFVESEINLAYRDWEEETDRRHYDSAKYTNLTGLFRSDVIAAGNYYKYDYSLSVSKLVNSQITWGELLPQDYDINDYSTCYVYQPNKVIYSLPQQEESKKDNWRVFLVNNYKNFINPVTAIKSINKTGALFMMKQTSPLQFLGLEELKLDGTNTKVTIGDGGLFTGPQQLQALVNADQSFEYGSNQSRYSTIGTTKGIFWVSQNQGKIFQYAGQLNEISNNGMKWWFAKYLPSELLKIYPGYPLFDNPVKGIGVQVIYDNITEVLYVSKKDYKPLYNDLRYDNDGNFYDKSTKIDITNKDYFEDASWTASYDTKTQTWISFHDWIPTFLLPSKTHFMSVNGNTIWKHNVRCDHYCNFYNVDYPFEIEFVSATGQQVVSMRNIEYLLEVYNYRNDCRDKLHVLDENFDQAIVYNSEQISGLLNLKLKPKNNPLASIQQPIINYDSIDIYYSKEEQKYRFNQFWDITNNRGEFSKLKLQEMFITKPNGYEYSINPKYVNYGKNPLERKKFRHNVNRVFLRKTESGRNKILFKLSNQKLLPSYR